MTQQGIGEVRSGIKGFRLLRLSGSAFAGFVRDQYTTLPDIRNRPLHMWLDVDWTYIDSTSAFSKGAVTKQVRAIVHEVFDTFESGSIQQIIYQIGTKMLADIASIAEIHLEANNRTWDTILEEGDQIGVYTDARPPYGCLGLTLKR
jgi:urate oxidase